MLKKRIIACLDVRDGRTVKGVNFVNIRDAGDPVDLAKRYAEEGADELVFLDIAATLEKRRTLTRLVSRVAAAINIPFTVGGGIHSLTDAQAVIESGADKISVNSSAIRNPGLITVIAEKFGRQCVVAAIDTKRLNNQWMVYSNGGTTQAGMLATEWAQEVVARGAGEILLTSMQGDGTQQGFSLDITGIVANIVSIPVIASGGAGSPEDFAQVFENTKASAALAASVFHFQKIKIPALKQFLKQKKIPIR